MKKTWISTAIDNILNKAENKGEVLNLVTETTIDGKVLEFKDVAEGEKPKEGDIATIDGKAVEAGDITLANGDVLTFDDKGAVTKITVAQTPEEMQAEIVDLKAKLEAKDGEVTALIASVTEIKEKLVSGEAFNVIENAPVEKPKAPKAPAEKSETTDVMAKLEELKNKRKTGK